MRSGSACSEVTVAGVEYPSTVPIVRRRWRCRSGLKSLRLNQAVSDGVAH
jgi:hypothetical protein